MAAQFCAICGRENPPLMTRCLNCGAFLRSTGPPSSPAPSTVPTAATSSPAPLPSGSWAPPPLSQPPPPPPDWPAGAPALDAPLTGDLYIDQEIWQARDRTKTGVLLLAVGIAISWIPIVGGFGGLLALIGVILLFLGRHGFTEPHRADVVLGGALLLVSVLGAIVLAVWVAGSIVSAGSTVGATSQDIANAAVNALQGAAYGALVLGVIGATGQLLMVWELADTSTRWLLILGLLVGLALGVVVLAVEVPLFSQAFQQATAGGGYNRGPIDALNSQIQAYSLLRIFPAAISAFAYYRIWSALSARIDAAPAAAQYA